MQQSKLGANGNNTESTRERELLITIRTVFECRDHRDSLGREETQMWGDAEHKQERVPIGRGRSGGRIQFGSPTENPPKVSCAAIGKSFLTLTTFSRSRSFFTLAAITGGRRIRRGHHCCHRVIPFPGLAALIPQPGVLSCSVLGARCHFCRVTATAAAAM
ncbi:arsenite-activated ATPase ArsA [Anopheles sinensis]|uniref:Arsenite-activated ATPase ArsA n=1 Tax=Anopheles sinensis TaxID=74873 RepID=A0A084VK95_ANOSI|nr:arsenite-activated ATPase ArsA [Anopheles sinensis]